MRLRISVFDIVKFDKLLEENEFMRRSLKPLQGEWLIETTDLKNIKFFLEKAGIRHKIL